jgi:predicted enzyme related to lactoylglutathione lyase
MSTTLRFSKANVFVGDQDEALAFYTEKLGFEVGEDADLGFMRWLTVHAPGQPEVSLILCDPTPMGPPEKIENLRKVIADGLGGGPLFVTDDCQGTYEELKAKGVEFTQEPKDAGYGIDAELTDPFGNRLRFIQLSAS